MIVLSHPTGATHAHMLAEALSDTGFLERFYTSLDLTPLKPLIEHLPRALADEANRRVFALSPGKSRTVLLREALALMAERLPVLHAFELTRSYRRNGMNRQFDRAVARHLTKEKRARGFYGYIDSSPRSLEMARNMGLTSFIEMTTCFRAFDEALFAEERELQPGWAATLPPKRAGDGAFGADEQARILHMATHIVAPSRFVLRSLPQAVSQKSLLYPYSVAHKAVSLAPTSREKPLRVLFVGALTQRKGIAYLASALNRMGADCQLTVIGRKVTTDCQAVDRLLMRAIWHPSLPNPHVRRIMQQHDVLVLPSLSDAFGLVVTEAMGQGLPVIVTHNVGAGELIRDGQEGFILPVRDSDAIAQALHILAADRDRLEAMRFAAWYRAEELLQQNALADFVAQLSVLLKK
ncbi:glycosyltransferase family 4 protein [Altericroceibacterium spongiae]|uniref:glycosyltransferase family 4 protein n=1 Tax=Altericroceibacterium spongiae TaxID=2320269 RepID=UPI001602D949|nr:glycosyltransferase family 4 protein [Altericroceibacterium spongiae]